MDALYEAVGRGTISAADVLLATMPKELCVARPFAGASAVLSAADKADAEARKLCRSMALYGTVVNVADLLPGDDIVGIVTPGQGVVMSSNARELAAFEDSRERWVPMKWDSAQLFTSRVDLTAVNRTGSLSVITQTIADFDANIELSLIHLNEVCDATVDVQVRDKNIWNSWLVR